MYKKTIKRKNKAIKSECRKIKSESFIYIYIYIEK